MKYVYVYKAPSVSDHLKYNIAIFMALFQLPPEKFQIYIILELHFG